ncbi:UvrD-helicase domain-containing protein [Vogesella fluminis]|uniref:UvrD-helicase domain-containing protein n=1 Tax=Vogesella fluminis TaxID=1069161 RepID=UPI001675BED0|nr:UvrD-helicase domain-containing protein [Vogesella fluminis]
MSFLLETDRGCVTAPAGTGKTQLLAEAVATYRGSRPILVLTHTNAGVAAMRRRLKTLQVDQRYFQISTLDGLALRLVKMFPQRSCHQFDANAERIDYPAVREAMVKLLSGHAIDDVLKANFARILVDEYQDCDVVQHTIVCNLAELFPTCVLGDPLQQIFTFRGNTLPTWDVVQGHFHAHHTLNTPWRWLRAETPEFGNWLLGIRSALLNRQRIDLSQAPRANVEYIPSGNEEAIKGKLLALGREPGPSLIIGNSMVVGSRHQLGRITPGASIVEPVDLRDLTTFARDLDAQLSLGQAAGNSVLGIVHQFAQSVMTALPSQRELQSRIASIRSHRNINPPSPLESQAILLEDQPSYIAISGLLKLFHEIPSARVFRPTVFRTAIDAIAIVVTGHAPNLLAAVAEKRERMRHTSPELPRCAIGSTLLLKGLESEKALITDANDMNTRHLYVALTRASKKVVVCATSPHLPLRV